MGQTHRTGYLMVLLLFVSSAAHSSSAVPLIYRWVPDTGGSFGVQFSVGYTFGKHTGKALGGEGRVFLKSDDLVTLQRSELRVPIGSLRTGKAEMDCHLRESLGLDYSHSAYPKDHVCMNDQIPLNGPDAVVYPDIVLQLDSARRVDADHYAVFGRWKIHGVSRPVEFPVHVSTQGRRLVVDTAIELSLKNFGVEVKNFLFVTTDDRVQLDLQLQFERVERVERE